MIVVIVVCYCHDAGGCECTDAGGLVVAVGLMVILMMVFGGRACASGCSLCASSFFFKCADACGCSDVGALCGCGA